MIRTAVLFAAIITSAGAADRTLKVAADGAGDFRTLQEAIATVPENSPDRTVLEIKPGRYHGPVVISAKLAKVTLRGEDAQTTIIDWERNVKGERPPGADGTNPGVSVAGKDFHAENITFQNSSGDQGQGLALRVDADRAVFAHCRFLGWQDTLMINGGRQYFHDCYLEGRVDFIYGDATAFFENCEVHSKNGGYVTAASTPANHPFGFVFRHCRLTGDTTPWPDPNAPKPPKPGKFPNTHLGRPWRPDANVIFLECEMGEHIQPEGWNNWGQTAYQTTARYGEYASTGPGAHPDQRVYWARRLTKEEADKITPATVLTGPDAWNPEIEK